MGQAEDQQIVEGSVIETDPLLNAYVQGIADNLWNQVARKDVRTRSRSSRTTINSFATIGGFVYVYEGLVDFVQSDDELASVIGHETGHIERRHVHHHQLEGRDPQHSLRNRLDVLAADLRVRRTRRSRHHGEDLARDELQADRYGLQLMSRAGYDPEVDGHDDGASRRAAETSTATLVTKYLEDHPEPVGAVAHLDGLSGTRSDTTVTPAQELVQASSDEERARYEFASPAARTHPQEGSAATPKRCSSSANRELALGLPSKSEQTLAEAAQIGSPATRATANERIAALRQLEVQARHADQAEPAASCKPHADGASVARQNAVEIQARARGGQGSAQVDADAAHRHAAVRDSRPQPHQHPARFARRSDREEPHVHVALAQQHAPGHRQASARSAASVRSRRTRRAACSRRAPTSTKRCCAPFSMTPIPAESLALLPSYPQMVNELSLRRLRDAAVGRRRARVADACSISRSAISTNSSRSSITSSIGLQRRHQPERYDDARDRR